MLCWFVVYLMVELAACDLVVNDDLFYGYGGKIQQQVIVGNKTLNIPSSLRNLRVLSNDLVKSKEMVTCSLPNQMKIDDVNNMEFKEVAEMVGFHHTHKHRHSSKNDCHLDFVIDGPNNYTTRFHGEECTQEKMTGAVAAGDYDNDGFVDVFFTVYYGPSLLYKNNGDGTFSDVTRVTGVGPNLYGSGAGWVDIDSDGDLDLYVTTVGDIRHYLYINQGGYFTEEAKQRGISLEFSSKRKLAGYTPVFGDYDQDGFLDVFTSEWILHSSITGSQKTSATRLFRNKGKKMPGYFEDHTDFAGVNQDRHWDILRNDYTAATHVFGGSFTDFDNDGWPELLVSGDFGQSKMYWNNKNGTFMECTQKCGINGFHEAMGLAIGDFNRDGNMDFFQTAIRYNNKTCQLAICGLGPLGNGLYIGKGNRRFEQVTQRYGVENSKWGWGTAMFDFDNDGKLDIVSTDGFEVPSSTLDDVLYNGKDNIRLWQNKGIGKKMVDVTIETGLKYDGMGRGLIVLDHDNDGDEEILLAANVGPPKLFVNKGGNRNNWIKIRPMHKCENNKMKLCDSIGAKIYVTTQDGETQYTQVGSKTHFMGQSEVTCHFGVSHDKNVNVSIYWPRFGKRVNYENVATRQMIKAIAPQRGLETIKAKSFESCYPLKIKNITVQPNNGVVQINQDSASVSYNLEDLRTISVGVQYFQYSIDYHDQTYLGNVTLDFRGKPPPFMSPLCFMPQSTPKPDSKPDKRRLDGQANNKDHVTWGSAGINLKRLSPHSYADNISEPSAACTRHHHVTNTCPYKDGYSGMGSTRPSARLISNEIFRQTKDVFSQRKLSDLTMHFGQLLSHDTDHTTTLPRFVFLQYYQNQIWMPIPVPMSDAQYDPYSTGKESISFVRSAFNGCTGTYLLRNSPREQTNQITAFIDANMVYGVDKKRSDYLREFKDGRLKTGEGDLMPKNDNFLPNENPVHRLGDQLFIAGDIRPNVQPGLMALHVLFLREHNRLAQEYMHQHPTASDENAFQYARAFVIAEFQSIVYNEYLPAILGGNHHIPKYTGYKKDVDASIATEFSTAAFRFGHSQVNSLLFRLKEDGSPINEGHVLLRDAYFKPNRLEYEGGVDPLLRGAVAFPAQEVDVLMVDEMRDNLFPQDAASPGRQTGFDLAAFNIQRARDHGIGDFNSVRKALNLKEFKNFSEITTDERLAKKLAIVYDNDVNNIDLWVGGLAESHVKGSELGDTFHHIIVEQFTRIRDGDRFWYQNILSKEDIEKVERTTLSEIIKMNTLFKDCPKDVFFSTRHCSKVKDHQCVLSKNPNNEQTRNDDATPTERAKETSYAGEITLLAIAAIILSVLVCILVLVLIKMALSSKSKAEQYTRRQQVENGVALDNGMINEKDSAFEK